MPNWCHNDINLKGDKKYLDFLEDVQFDFNFIREVKEGEYNSDVWGTKWTADEILCYRRSDTELDVSCSTAWSPPDGIYETLVQKDIEVKASYIEEGCSFCGHYTTEDKKLVDHCFDIPAWEGCTTYEECALRVAETNMSGEDLEELIGYYACEIECYLNNYYEEEGDDDYEADQGEIEKAIRKNFGLI